MDFWESLVWSIVGLLVEPNAKKLSALSTEREKKLLGKCKTFQNYMEAHNKAPYYQDEVIGEKVLYGFIRTAHGGKDFEMALRRTIFSRLDYVAICLARRARTFDEGYEVLKHWDNGFSHMTLFEDFTAEILYRKIAKMARTPERKKRMDQFNHLNEFFGYSWSSSFYISFSVRCMSAHKY